jgi:hypothetical protein
MKFLRKKGHRTLHVLTPALAERMAEKGDLEVVEMKPGKPVKGPVSGPKIEETSSRNLEDMKRQELIKLAREKKIEDPFKMKNVELIGALRVVENQ